MKKFLDSIVESILEADTKDLSGHYIILPGKRAGQALKQIISTKLNKAHWAPKTFTLPELVTELTSCTLASRIEQTITLFGCYRSLGNRSAESFEDFIKWGNIVLNDFSDIEHHLIDPNKIFSDLRKIQDIQNWSFNNEELSEGQINYLEFWNDLGELYRSFEVSQANSSKFTYSGVLKNIATRQLSPMTPPDCTKFLFAGIANYSPAEQTLIEILSQQKEVKIYWDADNYYLNDSMNEAGSLIRAAIRDNHKVITPEEGLSNSFKTFYFNETVTSTAQAFSAAAQIGKLNVDQQQDCAVIITDNSLAEPFIHALDPNKTKIQIAYAFPLNQTKTCRLIYQIFSILSKSEKNNSGIYYKDFEELLNYLDVSGSNSSDNASITKYLIDNVIIYLGKNQLQKLAIKYSQVNSIIELTIVGEPIEKISQLSTWLENISDLDNLPEQEIAALTCIGEILSHLKELLTQFPDLANYHSIEALWFHLMNKEYLNLEAENTDGIKIMDLNETLAFDFKNIFILGANEENLPGNTFAQTLIPFDIRAVYKLPLPQQKDAALAYMFYRSIQRAENIHLYYSTVSSDYKGTEKSRFMSQIKYEVAKANEKIKIENKQLRLPENKISPDIKIPNNDWVKSRLNELFERGISPSAINKFNACPLDFYHRYILGLGEDDEMEEDLSSATIGSIVHKVLEDFYKSSIGGYPSPNDFSILENNLQVAINNAFESEYSQTNTPTGFNLLATEVIKNMLFSFLQFEKKRLEKMTSENLNPKLIAVEMKLSKSIPLDHYERKTPFKLYGLADRIEEVSGFHHILDYKTGKVEKKDIELPVDINEIFEDGASSKLLQMICYIYMYSGDHISPENCKAAFYSFRFHSQGWMYVSNKDRSEINRDILLQFEKALINWREKVYTLEHFEHNPKAQYCQFCQTNHLSD